MSDMLPRPDPRDGFKRALRAQLMTQAPAVLARRETTWTRFTGSLLRPAMVAAAIALLVAGSAGKAAADSLPGDIAYPLKVAAEQIQVSLALDDSTRLRLLGEQADHRLAELAEAVRSRPDAAPTATDEYAAAVERFTVAVDALRGQPGTSEDKKIAAEDVVDAAYQKHEAVIEQLERTAPAAARDGLERAKQQADKLHAAGRPARTPEPKDAPAGTRTPQPTRTTAPVRTVEPTRASEQPRVGDRTASPSVRR
ncbi:MAG TPA: DUF5667 domain-containing protein [Candidatus Limnocylindria bacterium]|jgi:hypothetical protein